MKQNIVLIGILSLALAACNQQVPKTELSNVHEEYDAESEIAIRDAIISALNAQLDSLKSQKTSSHKGLCFQSQNELYGTIQAEKIDCPEFAEHLNWMDTTIYYFNGNYSISITNSCNGPSDTDIEACNCSNNFYISTGSQDLPKTYHLFRVGPYREVENIQFSEKDQILRFNYLGKKDNTRTATLKINRGSVVSINFDKNGNQQEK